MCSNGTVHSSTYLSLTGTVRHSSTKRSFIYCLWWPLCRRFKPWREGQTEWREVGGRERREAAEGGREEVEGREGGRKWRGGREEVEGREDARDRKKTRMKGRIHQAL